jgi:EmrB/QacA subfamily drug resistance transporter
LGIASLGVLMAFVDSTIVNIAFPSLQRSFPSAGNSGISWVLNAYSVVFGAFLVAGGQLADVFGRRRIYTFALGLFTVASALCAAAPTLGLLVALRIVQALGAALMLPASLGLVLAGFPPERRKHAVALWSAVGAAAAGIGPSVGGALLEVGNWRLVFLINVPVGVLALRLARRNLVESRASGRRRMPDLAGATLFALAVAALLLGVVQGRDWGWTGVRVLGAWVVAVAAAAMFVQRLLHRRNPAIDPQLLRSRGANMANLSMLALGAGFASYALINVLFLTDVWQYSILRAGLALTPGPVIAFVAAAISSRVAERIDPRVVLVAGALVWGEGVLWMIAVVGGHPHFLYQWLPGMVVLGIGAGMAFPNLSAAAVGASPPQMFAMASALNTLARQVGFAIGVAGTVTLIGTPAPSEAFAAFHRAWWFAACCFLVASLGCLAVGRPRRVAGAGRPSLDAAAREVLQAAPDAPPVETVRPDVVYRPPAAPPPLPESTADFLAAVPLFAGLPAEALQRLAERSRELRLDAGDWLFRAGDPADALFVIRAGRLLVLGEEPDAPVLRELSRGGAVGELALLMGDRRSASVRAARATDLIVIERSGYEELVARSPQLFDGISRVLAGQLRQSRAIQATVRPLPSTIAVVTAGYIPNVPQFARALTDALSRHCRADLVVRPEPTRANGLAAFGPLLDRCEQANDRTVLLAGDVMGEDPWTRFCLQQADRVLVLAGGGPLWGGAAIPPELVGCDLVACDVRPGSGALAEWVKILAPIETHAVRLGDDTSGSIARLARRLNGRSVGLVLSGGGARAFSHIGVIDELLSAGMIIDRVAGVSMGAYIGAMLAAGFGPAEIDARCYEEFVRRRPLSDFTLPRHALIRAERISAALERTFGELCIEELELGFLCAATDLRAAELVVERYGRLSDAVAASFWLPIYGAPLVRGRQLLLDGSLIDNLPVATVAAMGEGPIVAVDVKATPPPRPPRPAPVSTEGQPAAPATRSDGPSRRESPNRAMRRRLAGGGRSTPPLFGETLTRLALLASANTSAAAARHADLVIEPRNPGVGLLEWHQIDVAVAAGHAAAREALENAPGCLFGH